MARAVIALARPLLTSSQRLLMPAPSDMPAAPAGNAWAVGRAGRKTLILHWKGTAWTRVPSQSPSAGTHLLGAASAASA